MANKTKLMRLKLIKSPILVIAFIDNKRQTEINIF